MSAPSTVNTGTLADRGHALLGALVIGLLGRPWLSLWLRLYPRSADAVRWTFHEELAGASPRERWRRALAFYAQLPSLAAAQSEAESNPGTETGGEPPSGPPPGGAPLSGRPLGSVARDLGVALAGLIAAIVALAVWGNGMATLFDLIDARAVTGAETGAVAVTLVFGATPLVLVLQRRRFAWSPRRRADRDEGPWTRMGWWAATAVFGLLALVLYVRVLGQYLDAYDEWPGIDMAFGAALGLAAVFVIGTAPLAWVVRQRYWVGRAGR